MRVRFAPVTLVRGTSAVLLAVLAACSEPIQPIAPVASDVDAPVLSLGMDRSAPAAHVIVFKGKAPRDFGQRITEAGGRVELNHHLGIAVVSGLSADRATALRATLGAEHIEAMPEFQLVEPAAVGSAEPATLAAVGDAVASPSNPATAAYYSSLQWNMAQVNASAAWAAGRLGSPSVRVAILDTGIDYLLPDFTGRVDLTRSASFTPRDDSVTAALFPTRHPSTDLHYHGTNVATQVSSNALGFAGVTSKTTLMSVKVCGAIDGCVGVIQGILYAIDNGADVINMSLGGWFRKSAYPGTVSAYNRVMNYAKQQGVTIVVAAGNDGIDLDRQNNVPIEVAPDSIVRVHIPSFFSTYCDATNVICVAASSTGDKPASFTNFGRSAIDVSAPGVAVYSLCPRTSLVIPICRTGLYLLPVSGTSQASPHVAGLAALAVEDVGRDPAKVKAYIRNSADPIGGGNSPFHGKGRINVGRAVGVTN